MPACDWTGSLPGGRHDQRFNRARRDACLRPCAAAAGRTSGRCVSIAHGAMPACDEESTSAGKFERVKRFNRARRDACLRPGGSRRAPSGLPPGFNRARRDACLRRHASRTLRSSRSSVSIAHGAMPACDVNHLEAYQVGIARNLFQSRTARCLPATVSPSTSTCPS